LSNLIARRSLVINTKIKEELIEDLLECIHQKNHIKLEFKHSTEEQIENNLISLKRIKHKKRSLKEQIPYKIYEYLKREIQNNESLLNVDIRKEEYSKVCEICKILENIIFINQNGKGCCSFIVYGGNIDEKIEKIKPIINSIEPSYFDSIPLYDMKIIYREGFNISKEYFCNTVTNILEKYGIIIQHKDEYKEDSNVSFIKIRVLTCEFTFPISTEINNAIRGSHPESFRIPRSTNIDLKLLELNSVKEIFKEWIKENRLNLKQIGLYFYGSHENVCRAKELITTNPPNLPFESITIPGGTNLEILLQKIQTINQSKNKEQKIFLNKTSKILTYPKTISREDINQILSQCETTNESENNNEEKIIIGDEVLCCGDDAIQSRNPIFIFNKDGTYESHNFCATCVLDTLKYSLGKSYNEDKGTVEMKNILENMAHIEELKLWECQEDPQTHEIWPIISFGQLMWSLLEEPLTSNATRGYLTAIAVEALHKSQYVTYCPFHPSIIFPRPPFNTRLNCKDESCKCFLCPNCNKWHVEGKCESIIHVPPGFRVCPSCKNFIEKTENCNRITCRCGKSFCYYCEAGPYNTQKECYDHIHSSIICLNDPPDYLKFCKRQNISDQALNDFYSKYPKFKNRTIIINNQPK